MGTAETLIVFSALMALIALVAIGIDWIGKPLKHRRFIERVYRFDDEKLPVDEFGNPTLGPVTVPSAMFPGSVPAHAAAPVPHIQPAPVVVARVETIQPAHAERAITPAPNIAATAGASAVTSSSAFSDTLAAGAPQTTDPLPGISEPDVDHWLGSGSVPTPTDGVPSGPWQPGMPLDTTVDDRKPNLATKAERFWMSIAAAMNDSHFDPDNLQRMAAGKAPRRTNPRSGRMEAMQLTGLRQASQAADVSMRWPGDSVDPWNAT